MANLHQRLLREARAQREFEHHARRLTHEIETGVAALEHLHLRVQVLELLLEQTGGNLLTDQYREMLCDLKRGLQLLTERRNERVRPTAALRIV
jgi:hypothetical protein